MASNVYLYVYSLACDPYSACLSFLLINSIAGGALHYLLYYLSPLLIIEMFSIRLSEVKENRTASFSPLNQENTGTLGQPLYPACSIDKNHNR
jgi:hypothetical protein